MCSCKYRCGGSGRVAGAPDASDLQCKGKYCNHYTFTTCGTICSFPDFCRDNKLFENAAVEIEDEFRMIPSPQYPAMPTGGGLLHGMNLKAIQEVGLLDEEISRKRLREEE